MAKSLREIRFLLLGVWVVGLAGVVVQGLTDAAPPWACVLLAASAGVLGQVAIGLNKAEAIDSTVWQIENTVQRYLFWLLVMAFLAFAAKPFVGEPDTPPLGSAVHEKPVVAKPVIEVPAARLVNIPNQIDKPLEALSYRQEAVSGPPDPVAISPDLWDKMDKYASVFGLVLTSIGLLMAVLTGWVIVVAFEFRGQLKELQAASKVDGKLAAATRAADSLSVKTHLHGLQLDCVVGTPDYGLLTFAMRSLRMAEEGLSMTADLANIVTRLNHAADAMRNGAPHAEQRTLQACREYMPIVLVQLMEDSLQTGSHMRGREGASYRDALRKLLHTVKGL